MALSHKKGAMAGMAAPYRYAHKAERNNMNKQVCPLLKHLGKHYKLCGACQLLLYRENHAFAKPDSQGKFQAPPRFKI